MAPTLLFLYSSLPEPIYLANSQTTRTQLSHNAHYHNLKLQTSQKTLRTSYGQDALESNRGSNGESRSAGLLLPQPSCFKSHD